MERNEELLLYQSISVELNFKELEKLKIQKALAQDKNITGFLKRPAFPPGSNVLKSI